MIAEDMKILVQEPEEIEIGGRTYEVRPLGIQPLVQIGLLLWEQNEVRPALRELFGKEENPLRSLQGDALRKVITGASEAVMFLVAKSIPDFKDWERIDAGAQISIVKALLRYHGIREKIANFTSLVEGAQEAKAKLIRKPSENGSSSSGVN